MHEPEPKLPRRQFLGGMSWTVGGLVMGSTLPVSLLQAAPQACLVNAADWPDTCGDWTLDDICNAYPPYAFRIEAGAPGTAPLDAVDPVDRHWVG